MLTARASLFRYAYMYCEERGDANISRTNIVKRRDSARASLQYSVINVLRRDDARFGYPITLFCYFIRLIA